MNVHLKPVRQSGISALLETGELAMRQERYDDAVMFYRMAVDQSAANSDGVSNSDALCNLGTAFMHGGNLSEAEAAFAQALAEAERYGASATVITAMRGLALVLERKGETEKAESLLRTALKKLDDTPEELTSEKWAILNNLATLLEKQGDMSEAEALLRRSLEISRQSLKPGNPNLASPLGNLAVILSKQGHDDEAEAFLREALDISEDALGIDHPDTVIRLNNLAVLLQRKGEFAEAHALFERALDIASTALGPDHPTTKMVMENAIPATLNEMHEAPAPFEMKD